MIHFSKYLCRAALPICLVAVLVAAGALNAGTAVTQPPTTSRQPIVVNSVFSNIDYTTNTADFTDIVVSQGDARLTAERASTSGVGFKDSEWTFVGRVVISSETRGTLHADQAILKFHNGELAEVTAIGSPANFEHQHADAHWPASGHADRITYDVKQDTVSLLGHAYLSNGRDVGMSAPVFVYSVQEERLQGDSPGERRGVRATITP